MSGAVWDSRGQQVQYLQQTGSDHYMMNVCFTEALKCIKCIQAQFRPHCLRGQGLWESDRYHQHGYNSYLLHLNSAAVMRTLRVTPRLTSRLSHWHTSDSDCTVNYPSTFHGPGVKDREWVHPCIQPIPAMPPQEVKPECRWERQEDIGLVLFFPYTENKG